MPAVDSTTLLGLRTQLVYETGDYRLVGTQSSGGDTVPNFTVDAGADYHINKAIRWLERECQHVGKRTKKNVALNSGVYSVSVTARSISGIRVTDDDEFLTQVNETWLFEKYGEDLTAVSSDTTPLYWSFKTGDVDDVTKSIWVLPPPNSNRTLEVYGQYWTTALSAGDDTNWWTTNYSDAILYIAIRQVQNLDLNRYSDPILLGMIADIKRAIWTEDIQNEMAFFGDTMQG